MEKGTFSFTHEELKQTADVLRDNADWLESEFKEIGRASCRERV